MDKQSLKLVTPTPRGASVAGGAAATTPLKGAKRARPAQRTTPPQSAAPLMDSAQRYEMIAEAAYYRALARGFSAGGELQDWLQAEQEIDARLL